MTSCASHVATNVSIAPRRILRKLRVAKASETTKNIDDGVAKGREYPDMSTVTTSSSHHHVDQIARAPVLVIVDIIRAVMAVLRVSDVDVRGVRNLRYEVKHLIPMLRNVN
jgi:hypothetical protein